MTMSMMNILDNSGASSFGGELCRAVVSKRRGE